MIRHVVLLVSVCGAVAALAGHAHQRQTAQDPSQQPSFRAGVDAVLLSVTVTDGESRLVTGITKEEFVVYEDGVQQEINFFTRTQVPIALAILIDTSGSMDEKMSTAQEAAIGFVRRLRPEDRAEIIDFDIRPNIRQVFTNDIDALELAILQTSAGGTTSLYMALYVSLTDLKKVPLRVDDVRREAVVVLSDGKDTSSVVSFEDVLELAKRSETAIYSIGLRSSDSRLRKGEADVVLRQLAQETGGPGKAGDMLQVHLLRPRGEIPYLHVLEHASTKGGHEGSS